MTTGREFVLYRFFDADGGLLYIRRRVLFTHNDVDRGQR